MRRLVLLWLASASLAACGPPIPDASDGAPDDARVDAWLSETTEASGRIWCEDGVVYAGQLADYTQPGPAPCLVDEPGRWAFPPSTVFTCEHGCGIADAGTGCESCYGRDGGIAACNQDPSMYCAPGPDAAIDADVDAASADAAE